MLKRKRSLEILDGHANVKVFEDISRPRLAFINLMKRDNRIAFQYSELTNTFHWNDNFIFQKFTWFDELQ